MHHNNILHDFVFTDYSCSESAEEDNDSQSTLSSINIYGGQPSSPPAPRNSSTALAAAPQEQKEGQREERASDPVTKVEAGLKPTPGQGESDDDTSPPSKRTSSKKGSKRRRKREIEEGEDSESVDSESDSDSSYEKREESRSHAKVSRSRRNRRPRSPVHPPPSLGGESQSKIPSVCRHFLNGK